MSNFYRTEPEFNPDDASDDYERVHCDQCDELIIDGAPENERIGRGYYCPRCAGEKKAALAAMPMDLHDTVRGR